MSDIDAKVEAFMKATGRFGRYTLDRKVLSLDDIVHEFDGACRTNSLKDLGSRVRALKNHEENRGRGLYCYCPLETLLTFRAKYSNRFVCFG